MQVNKRLQILLTLLFVCFSAACKSQPPASDKEEFKPVFRKDGTLWVISPVGETKAAFDIEIAEKDKDVLQGLKYREDMEDNQGMFFIFQYLDYHSFWMQDTFMSLDMLFMDSEGVITHIEKGAAPFSEELITPNMPNKYVLEVKAGIVDRLNIKELDKIKWERN
ncbi:MAG: DUF192 domain-containing protein [Candidatus Cloacimonetes bacterium]|jgi:uncharacterized membrane protein (UPF0127 family)|nr:DUF192 domain-containing protein [Candidatus Cloacimonadota bacterium]NLO44477.1 DUF192 domain-containing protein [Candidatus Cloacimonadota bacterium]